MDRSLIEENIRQFLADGFNAEEVSKVSGNESLLEKGLIDSVRMLELIEFIESTFNIKVDEEDLIPENFDTINDIVNYISSCL